MSHTFKLKKALLFAPVVMGLASTGAFASEREDVMLHQLADEGGNIGQNVNSVSELNDISPTDWAFQAVRNLVERYECIDGYPDRTFRGDRPLTRYEFAAALNRCLNRILEIVGGTVVIDEPDLTAIERLQQEFRNELRALRGRVDDLEGRLAEVEANQFSTTTKLKGEVIFALFDSFGDAIGQDDDETQTAFGYRARLNFDTSFTGKDRLRTRIQARNIEPIDGGFSGGTDQTRLGFDGLSPGAAIFNLDDLYYSFPVADKAKVYIAANSFEPRDFITELAPFISSGSGAVSRFGRLNPVMRIPDGGVGIGVDLDFDVVEIQFGYLSEDGPNPEEGQGLFNGSLNAFANVVFSPFDQLKIGAFYNRSFEPAGDLYESTGSQNAEEPFGGDPVSADSIGGQLQLDLDPFIFAGWYGISFADAENGTDDSATIQNFGVQLGIKDVGTEGSLLGLVFGLPPKVTDNDVGAFEDDDNTYHLEGFYRFKITDNIAITPGAFVLFNPENDSDNDEIVVGTIRTTFKF